MTYHTLLGNNVMPKLRSRMTRGEKRWTLLALGIFLYGCVLVWLTAGAVKPDYPSFNCQEDEIMQWVDARHTSECVNIEEWQANPTDN